MIRMYGQAPSRGDEPGGRAFQGPPNGTLLASLAGVTESHLNELIDMRNVLESYPGPGQKGDLFPISEARQAARAIARTWENGDRVVFAGRAVADAFGFTMKDWLKWRWWSYEDPGTEVDVHAALFPHPSMVNRWWNDRERVHLATQFMQDLVAHG